MKKKTKAEIIAEAESDPQVARELGIVSSVMNGKEIKTPELDKMSAAKVYSQRIGEFLDWLTDTKKVHLARTHRHGPKCDGWDDGRGRYNPAADGPECGHYDGESIPLSYQTEDILAEFFEIDLKKVDDERRAILDSIR